MVQNVRTKNVKSNSIQVAYLIHVQEIKPWPPSQSLRYLRSVLIQWEHGDRSSGSTNSVVPSLGSVSVEGKIEFNESFRLPVTLLREVSVKARDADIFQKNCLEFNLYEQRRDKAAKGQVLATAIIDLADYGLIKEPISTRVPMSCKRSFGNTDQPILFIKIQLVGKGRISSSTRDTLSKELSLDKHDGESEEYAEESEYASYTDDDVSSHSSLALTSSTSESSGGLTSQNEENGKDKVKKDGTRRDYKDHVLASKVEEAYGNTEDNSSTSMRSNDDLLQKVHVKVTNGINAIGDEFQQNSEQTTSNSFLRKVVLPDDNSKVIEKVDSSNSCDLQVNEEDAEKYCNMDRNLLERSAIIYGYLENNNGKKQKEIGKERQKLDWEKQSSENELSNRLSEDATGEKVPVQSDTLSLSTGNQGIKANGLKGDGSKHVKSVRSTLDPGRSNGLVSVIHHTDMKEIGGLEDSQNGAGSLRCNERIDAKVYSNNRSPILDSKIQKLEYRIKKLEGELRETAAIEAALYSVVADHGSSTIKIHAPARRLSRLYLHACRESSQSRRGSAARSAVSGLVVVAKACGHDVPRLTFWLSNSVVLRAIISQSTWDPELSIPAGPYTEKNGDAKGNNKISLKWKDSSPSKDNISGPYGSSFCDWEDPHTFISALEKVEAWIFSRIVESIWWQTLIPHMLCAATKENYGRMSSLGDQEQENFSLDLWKKAFKDARERLCPVRAGGHECGCLPVLARLIMEQSVARLDVAMFNAILRESADEMPTDPVSDPISDSEVLPIPAGKTSFGAGAQLKNAIGNWSRLLTDIFGIDDDSPEDEIDDTDEMQKKSFKSFHLLNALSDLMMLPKDMLLSKSIRKEVCPAFGALLIKRVLDKFLPDDFCPDQIPDVVLEALDSEDSLEDMEESITNYPSPAAPTVYLPPTAASIAHIIGEFGNQSQRRRTGSSVLRKSYTSDDELDELNSPLASIFLDGSDTSPISKKSGWTSKENYNRNALRYELLQDVWMNSI